MKVYWLDLTLAYISIMLSAARLPQVRAEACISLQAFENEVNLDCPNHVRAN